MPIPSDYPVTYQTLELPDTGTPYEGLELSQHFPALAFDRRQLASAELYLLSTPFDPEAPTVGRIEDTTITVLDGTTVVYRIVTVLSRQWDRSFLTSAHFRGAGLLSSQSSSLTVSFVCPNVTFIKASLVTARYR